MAETLANGATTSAQHTTYLLLVILGIGQQRRDVEHDLVAFVDGVDRIGSSHVPCVVKWKPCLIRHSFLLVMLIVPHSIHLLLPPPPLGHHHHQRSSIYLYVLSSFSSTAAAALAAVQLLLLLVPSTLYIYRVCCPYILYIDIYIYIFKEPASEGAKS